MVVPCDLVEVVLYLKLYDILNASPKQIITIKRPQPPPPDPSPQHQHACSPSPAQSAS